MPEQKSITVILWSGFLAMAFQVWFALLEGILVMVAIKNQHYSLYYFGFALAGLLLAWKAYQWRKTNPTMKGLALFVHIFFTILMVIAFFIGMAFFLFMLWMYSYWTID
jgi:hypothetical protein